MIKQLFLYLVSIVLMLSCTEVGVPNDGATLSLDPTIAVSSVTLNNISLSLKIGGTVTLAATVSPSNATDKSVTWSSTNTSVATVSQIGVVKAVSTGTATIKATAGGKTATCFVTVSEETIDVTSVTLNNTTVSLYVGESTTLTATVSSSNATDKSVTWSSTNTSVATVSQSGVVKAVSTGTATIKATAGGKTATCSITVSEETIDVTSVTLNNTTVSLYVGESTTLTATVSPSNATDKSVTWSSTNTSVATVSQSGVVKAMSTGAATIKATAGGKTATCSVTVLNSPVENGHEYVDLGLSVKWANCNVGANTIEEYGDFFAWGETSPKSDYSWSTYKYCHGSYDNMIKYCKDSYYGYNGYTDNKTVLDLEDDAANANWGVSWRMPTDLEWEELCSSNNCTWTWTTINGIKGYKVQSKKTSYTDNWIFLPAAGCRSDTDLGDLGSGGYYWSGSLDTSNPCHARTFYFNSSSRYMYGSSRLYGQSVRPVCQ